MPTPGPGRFLDALDEGAVAGLRSLAVMRHWPAGSPLLHEGDRADRVLVVDAGRVKISALTPDGIEVVLAIRGPGELVGELSAVDGSPHSATATAIDDVACLALDSRDFARFLGEHPAAALQLIHSLAGRLRDADRKRVEFGGLDSTGRVASRLVELAEDHGRPTADGVRITVGLTQTELAGFTGSSREAVSRALRILRSDGLITTHRRGVTVHDMEALRARGI